MNKRWKVFWIVCTVLAVLGIGLFSAGALMGGFTALRGSEDERILNAWLDRLGIGIRQTTTVTEVVEELEDLEETELLGDMDPEAKEYVPEDAYGTEAEAYEGIRELELEVNWVSVRVLPWDGEEVLVDTSHLRADLEERIQTEQDGEELEIKMEGRTISNTNDTGTMYISVPRGMVFEKVTADAGAGLIEIEGAEARKLSVKAGVGQIILKSFSAEKLEAECGAGQMILAGEITEKAEINCGMGEVLCTFPGQREAYDYEISCSAGSVSVDGETFSGVGRTVKEDNRSSCEIEADCGMGNVEIRFE